MELLWNVDVMDLHSNGVLLTLLKEICKDND